MVGPPSEEITDGGFLFFCGSDAERKSARSMMTMSWATQLPLWADEAIFSVVAVLGSSLIGQFIKRVVCRRLATIAKQTSWQWDEILKHEFVKRLHTRYNRQSIRAQVNGRR